MFKLVVLVSSLALAAAKPSLLAPGLYGNGLIGPGIGHLGLAGPGIGHLGLAGPGIGHLGLAGLGISPLAPTVWGGSLAPGQPANVLGVDGRPLDTLDVNLARAQHLTARIVDGSRLHLLKKRSIGPLGWASPLAVSHTSRVDLPGRIIGAPIGWGGPVGLAAPWGVGAPLAHGAPLSPLGLGRIW